MTEYISCSRQAGWQYFGLAQISFGKKIRKISCLCDLYFTRARKNGEGCGLYCDACQRMTLDLVKVEVKCMIEDGTGEAKMYAEGGRLMFLLLFEIYFSTVQRPRCKTFLFAFETHRPFRSRKVIFIVICMGILV